MSKDIVLFRGLDQTEFLSIIGSRVSGLQTDDIGYGTQIIWEPKNVTRRIGRRVTFSPMTSLHFLEAALGWLPTGPRVVWISHLESADETLNEFISSSFSEVFSGSNLYEPRGLVLAGASGDQVATSDNGRTHVLVMCLLLAGWDFQILVPEADEFIDVWEGNIFFHSSSDERLEQAEVILNRFDLLRPIA